MRTEPNPLPARILIAAVGALRSEATAGLPVFALIDTQRGMLYNADMETKTWFVYGLVDPNKWVVRYVGWTFNPLSRLASHIRSAKKTRSHKAHWLRTLASKNQKPVLIILEIGITDWQAAERKWIAHYRRIGVPLTNGTDGGDGTPGCYPRASTRRKMSKAHKGRKMSPEAIKKTADALRGRPFSAEHCAALARVRKGRIPVKATAAAAKANKGRKQTPEHIKARFAAIIGKGRPEKRRLTNDQVRYVRTMKGKRTLIALAAELGLGQTMIHAIQHRRKYVDIPD